MSYPPRAAALLAVALVLPAVAPLRSEACQKPPGSEVPCRIVPVSPVVSPTDPFEIYVTVVNMPITAPFPPPYLDDLTYDVTVWNETSRCIPQQPGQPGAVDVDPMTYSIELDEVWSPNADEPTADTHTILVTPTAPGDYFSFLVNACALAAPGGCQRSCNISACIRTDPANEGVPYAKFLEPIRSGDAGSTLLPFRLRVLRNGYDPSRPLTVRVLPENLSDPIDIFPTSPPGLSTTGTIVNGDDETLEFTCSTHFPCFVGVDNNYHVTIHDGLTLLWDSRSILSTGIGRAIVDRSPLTRLELVEVLDDSGDGAIKVGEHAAIHLRLYARNPFFAAALDGVELGLPFPAELTVASSELHHHDNPMDTYDPTPAELLATGAVSGGPGSFRVDVLSVEARFTAPPFDPPPTVFRDLFEVELFLETPPGGLAVTQDLVFPGLTVSGTAAGNAKSETSASLVIPVVPSRPPNPIAVLYAVKDAAARLLWDDPTVDVDHDPATSYRVFRSGSAGSGYGEVATVADTPSSSEETVDAGSGPDPGVDYYRLIAANGDGDSEAPPSR